MKILTVSFLCYNYIVIQRSDFMSKYNTEEIKKMYLEGFSVRSIADKLSIGKTTVARIVKGLGISRPNIQQRNSLGMFGVEVNPKPKKCNTLKTYRNIIKDSSRCELCGSVEKLVVHHKDRNRTNNTRDNLSIVCDYCHRTVIHIAKRNPKGQFIKE